MRTRVSPLLAAFIMSGTLLTGCSIFGGDDKASDTSVVAEDQDLRRVQPDEAEKLIEDDDVVVLDIRAPEEFDTGHLADAENVNYYDTDFADQLDKLDKNKTYVMYCQSGNRSAKAINIMRDLGFTDVAEVDGGIARWQSDGLPVDKG